MSLNFVAGILNITRTLPKETQNILNFWLGIFLLVSVILIVFFREKDNTKNDLKKLSFKEGWLEYKVILRERFLNFARNAPLILITYITAFAVCVYAFISH
jgi:hypothetical protein